MYSRIILKKSMKLNRRSKNLRIETIKLSKPNGGYHFGGSFSCVEILIQLYDKILTKDDIFIMSKGHGCWPFYVLLRERNLKPILEGHPKYDKKMEYIQQLEVWAMDYQPLLE